MSKLREELAALRANIARTEQRLAEIEREWARQQAPCCPFCYSAEYRLLSSKQERREDRITQILKKLNLS
jgi:hypothetical protein